MTDSDDSRWRWKLAKFYDNKYFYAFYVGSMASSIYQHSLIIYDVIEVEAPKQHIGLKSSCKDGHFGIFVEGISSETNKLWPRVLYIWRHRYFRFLLHISKIAVNHNFGRFWLFWMVIESWWPKLYEQDLSTVVGSVYNGIKQHLFIKIR